MMRIRFTTLLALLLVSWALPLWAGSGETAQPTETQPTETQRRKPSIVLLLADQWRAQAFGFAGNPDVRTPQLDRLSEEAIVFTNAVSGCPVCCPHRASLLTGQRPLTHGVFMNDVPLRAESTSLAEVLAEAGYDTAYIGKWHLDGRGRSSFTPPERRQGFRYWKALECTHAYNRSVYYADEDRKLQWEGYDAIAQTEDARRYIRDHARTDRPFFLMLAWGPPHAPYHTAPERFRDLYRPETIRLRPNVPESLAAKARKDLAGYYAHCSALDECVGQIRETLRETGIERDTVLVFTSDHGDLLGSHGYYKKQQLYDESIRVPLLVRYPARYGAQGRRLGVWINTEDIMPTLLGTCGIPSPRSVEGLDYSKTIEGGPDPSDGFALMTCPQPFGQWTRKIGGREYRALRNDRYTYARSLEGPWLLFDDREDPFQEHNLVDEPGYAELRGRLDAALTRKLDETGDEFLPGRAYLEKWGYEVDATETVPYTN